MERNKTELTLGSLFSGSGGFELAGTLAGIKPVFNSEVEPFPIAVTCKRFPDVKHYGDVSTMDGSKIEPVDIITFGSPCQDMSIAGKRSGLDGERSSLFYEAVCIIKEMRCATNGKYPRYIVWENVPGAFSSNGGEDFKAVLEALLSVKSETVSVPRPERWSSAGEILGDGFSLAWRVLDAQYWGVPQRRKRIYLVADFAGESAGKILFESEGVSGYSAEGFRAWQRAAGSAEKSTGKSSICLNDQGGERMDVTEDVTSTLRAEAHHPPCVVESAGFCTEHSANSRGIGYEEEKSPTLRAGVVPAAVALYENHSQDTRYTGPLDTAPTVLSTYGTGGNNQPFVTEEVKALRMRVGKDGGGKGALIQDGVSGTLGCNNDQTMFVPQAYGISSFKSNAMLSDNPHAGIYEAQTSRTLDCSGGSPTANQGGVAVVESYSIQGNMIGRDDKNGPQGNGINKDVSFTLNATDHHAVFSASKASFFTEATENKANTLVATDYKDPPAVAYGIDRAAFNQGQNAKFGFSVEEEKSPTLVSRGPNAVSNEEVNYTVRRLTPTECARLQGFPDWWCSGLENPNPTDEELAFWTEVWETHRKVVSHSSKPKTEKQIRKWLSNPHSDSAEYKMWGNGVALPCVAFVLSGIVYYSQFYEE